MWQLFLGWSGICLQVYTVTVLWPWLIWHILLYWPFINPFNSNLLLFVYLWSQSTFNITVIINVLLFTINDSSMLYTYGIFVLWLSLVFLCSFYDFNSYVFAAFGFVIFGSHQGFCILWNLCLSVFSVCLLLPSSLWDKSLWLIYTTVYYNTRQSFSSWFFYNALVKCFLAMLPANLSSYYSCYHIDFFFHYIQCLCYGFFLPLALLPSVKHFSCLVLIFDTTLCM